MHKTTILLYICMAVISTIAGYILIGQNLQAKFYYVDDHEIPHYLNGKMRMNLTDINTALHKTEFYTFGNGARFRPIYSLFRVLETAAWGENSTLWYGARFILFVFSFYIFWILLKKYIGLIPGFLVIMATLTFAYWTDIWTRLGPGEIYCVPALAVFIWSYTNLLTQKTHTFNLWVLLFFSTIICVGSKETFVFLLPFILILDWYLIVKKRFSVVAFCLSSTSIGFILFIMTAILLYIHKTGVDFYMNSTSSASRLVSVGTDLLIHFSNLYHRFSVPLSIIVLALLGLTVYVYKQFTRLKSTEKKLLRRGLLELFLLTCTAIFVLLSQIYFYNGTWPTGTRYDFPGMLIIPLLGIAFYRFLKLLFKILKQPILYNGLFWITILLLIVETLVVGYKPLIKAGDVNVARSIEFSTRLTQIKNDLASDSSLSIVYESCGPQDYEFITSLTRFLTKDLQNRSVYLKFTYNMNSAPTNFDKYLAESLTKMSENGNQVLKPVGQILDTDNCYAINFSCPAVSCKKRISLVQPWCISPNNPKYTSPYRTQLAGTNCRL